MVKIINKILVALFVILSVSVITCSAASAVVSGSFNPSSGSYGQGVVFNIDVMLTPSQAHDISVINAYVYYDTSLLTVEKLVDYYPNGWNQSKMENDPNNKRIMYTKGQDPSTTPMKGVSSPIKLYTISFRVKDNAPENSSFTLNLGDSAGHFFVIMQGDTEITGPKTPGGPYIITKNQIPTAFDLLEPTNGKLNELLKPNFKWGASTDPDGGAINYDVILSKNADLSSPVVVNSGTNSYTPTANLEGGTLYYWQVIAKDVANSTRTSNQTWSFTTSKVPTDVGVNPEPDPITGAYYIGQTLKVTGKNFGSYVKGASKVEIGAVAVRPTSWGDTEIIFALPQVASGNTTLKVTAASGNAADPSNIKVSDEKIIVEDYEGGAVDDWEYDYAGDSNPDSGYFLFADPNSGQICKDIQDNDGDPTKFWPAMTTTNIVDGTKASQLRYIIDKNDGTEWGGGWGGKLANVLNFGDKNRIKLSIKGDGSSNNVQLILTDADGTTVKAMLPAGTLLSTTLKEVILKKSEFVAGDAGKTPGMDWSAIAGYNLVYTGETLGTDPYWHYIDRIVAYKDNTAKASLNLTVLMQGYAYDANGDGIKESLKQPAMVNIEFRTAPTANPSLILTKVALSDKGNVNTEIDGLEDGSYYVVVKQYLEGVDYKGNPVPVNANHLPIMTGTALSFQSDVATKANMADSTLSDGSYVSAYLATYSNGDPYPAAMYSEGVLRFMWTGDANGDGVVDGRDGAKWITADGGLLNPDGTTFGNWNAACDFNLDQVIDGRDGAKWLKSDGSLTSVPNVQ